MTATITLWLTFILASATIAWLGSKRQAIALAIVAALTLPAAFLTLGYPSPTSPPSGRSIVLGSRIDVDVAIYVLIDDQPEPRYYRLPYSAATANALQAAQDEAEGTGGAVVMNTGSGTAGFSEEHDASNDRPKQAETPMLQ
jgi:hypothetical protein